MEYKFYRNSDKTVKSINERYAQIKSQFDMYDYLTKAWSRETCAPRLRDKWSEENRTCGQCSITSFLVQDIFGGEVYGIGLGDGNFHCFNVIDDVVFDLTSEQFEKKLDYSICEKQNREVHFAKTEKKERYELLKKTVTELIPMT